MSFRPWSQRLPEALATRLQRWRGQDEGGSTPLQFLAGMLVAAVSAVICLLGRRYLVLADSIMIHVLGVVLASARFGVTASLFTAGISILSFDFFFLPPLLAFNVPDFRSFITFVTMSVVALVISRINQRLRKSELASRLEQARTASLYALTRDLAAARTSHELAQAARTHLERILRAPVSILLPDPAGPLLSPVSPCALDEPVMRAAARLWNTADASEQWSHEAGHLLVPLQGTKEKLGVVAVCRDPAANAKLSPHLQLNELAACAQQLAIALDRVARSRDVERAHLLVETERMRGALLSAISHDLRTPLTAILTAGTTLSQDGPALSAATRSALASVIVEETERLSGLVTNLLSMTRLDSGVQIKKIAEPIEDVLGAVLHRLDGRLRERAVEVHVPDDLPLVGMDAMLIEQLLLNLIENALRYSPAGSPLELRIGFATSTVEIAISDRGVGLEPGEEDKVFEKFYRGGGAVRGDGGVGLGLTICQAIAQAHGGAIAIRNREGGGATVQVTLPLEELTLDASALPEIVVGEAEMS